MSQKNPVNLKLFLSKQLSIIDFCIFNRSIKFHNKKMLQKQLNISSVTRNCSLPTFTFHETFTNLIQYELSQEESDLLKAGYTSLSKSINNFKSEEAKNQIIAHLFILPTLLICSTTNLLYVTDTMSRPQLTKCEKK